MSGPEPVLVRAPNPGVMTLEGTNTWVLPAPGGAVVIDPGPADPVHVAALERRGPVAAVLLTHRHADHSEALEVLAADAPVHAVSPQFARNPLRDGADPLRDGAGPLRDGAGPLRDDEVLVIGGARLRVLLTPGHTEDSACFLYENAPGGPLLFTGDTLLGGRSASSISRIDGSLTQYLDSLERLAGRIGVRGLPGHGPEIMDVAEHARGALEHRRARLSELAARLEAGGSPDAEEIARQRHPDRPEVWAPAAWMVRHELAHLARSIADGAPPLGRRSRRDGEDPSPSGTPIGECDRRATPSTVPLAEERPVRGR
nr:MBL fold metallo-hydrolase [Leucobacter weissii]